MPLNAYAVLDAFLASLRLLLGLLLIRLAVTAWRRSGLPGAEERQARENRNYLLSQFALLLLGLDLVSWPLLYLLLQSYVAESPGAMCIYGVTRIGAGSAGLSRFLPGLITTLQALKPLLVFVIGAWFVLYLLNRRTETAPLLKRLFPVLIACGALTVADAASELAYLGIPKQEEALTTGCCTGAFEAPSGFWGKLTEAIGTTEARSWLCAAYYGTNLLMVAALFAGARRFRLARRFGLAPLLVGACVSFVASGIFLVEVVAPTVLRLPFHHCPYDLIPRAPEVLVAVALFVWGAFSVGWACVAGWLGRSAETEPFWAAMVEQFLFMGCCCYLSSLVMTTLELALA